MNKELKELLSKAIKVAEETGNFVIEQAPDLLREFYVWEVVKLSLIVIFSLIAFITGVRAYIISERKGEDIFDFDLLYILTFIFGVPVGGTAFIISLFELLNILIAPKLYLIKYFL